MLYNININQYALIKSGIDIDLADAVILDFLRKLANSSKAISVMTDKGKFFMVKAKLIIDELPILGITTERGIRKRIDKLMEVGLLRKEMVMNKPFYQLSPKAYDLFFVEDTKSSEVEREFHRSGTAVPQEGNGSSAYNNIYINKNNNNNNKGEKENEKVLDASQEVIDDWEKVIDDWIKYKKERRESYKSEQSLKVFVKKIHEYSGGNVVIARKIIEQSIANNWAGIFPLKQSKQSRMTAMASMADNVQSIILEDNGTKPY